MPISKMDKLRVRMSLEYRTSFAGHTEDPDVLKDIISVSSESRTLRVIALNKSLSIPLIGMLWKRVKRLGNDRTAMIVFRSLLANTAIVSSQEKLMAVVEPTLDLKVVYTDKKVQIRLKKVVADTKFSAFLKFLSQNDLGMDLDTLHVVHEKLGVMRQASQGLSLSDQENSYGALSIAETKLFKELIKDVLTNTNT